MEYILIINKNILFLLGREVRFPGEYYAFVSVSHSYQCNMGVVGEPCHSSSPETIFRYVCVHVNIYAYMQVYITW